MKTKEEKIYEALGVKYFKKFVLLIGYFITRRKKVLDGNGSNYFLEDGTVDGMKEYIGDLMSNARGHAIAFLVNIVAASIGTISTTSIIIISVANIINLYCVMLQRYNYIRVSRAIKRKELIESKRNKNIPTVNEDNYRLKLLEELRNLKSEINNLTDSSLASSAINEPVNLENIDNVNFDMPIESSNSPIIMELKK